MVGRGRPYVSPFSVALGPLGGPLNGTACSDRHDKAPCSSDLKRNEGPRLTFGIHRFPHDVSIHYPDTP